MRHRPFTKIINDQFLTVTLMEGTLPWSIRLINIATVWHVQGNGEWRFDITMQTASWCPCLLLWTFRFYAKVGLGHEKDLLKVWCKLWHHPTHMLFFACETCVLYIQPLLTPPRCQNPNSGRKSPASRYSHLGIHITEVKLASITGGVGWMEYTYL